MNRAASRTPSSETPGLPARGIEEVDEVLGGEVAGRPGAYGQPPVPPADESKQRTPASRPAATLASAVPRVSWKWKAMRSSGMPASTASPVSAATWPGTPTPIVSPKQTSSTPRSSSRSATSTARDGSTRPVYGQPNAVET